MLETIPPPHPCDLPDMVEYTTVHREGVWPFRMEWSEPHYRPGQHKFTCEECRAVWEWRFDTWRVAHRPARTWRAIGP